MRSVRASAAELARVLPGDDVIATAVGSLTHAITIPHPPARVWPWLVQMGAGRGGWYSYDWIDNGRQQSTWRIEPALQAPVVGSLFPAVPGRRDGFYLLAQEPNRFLTLGFPGRTDGRLCRGRSCSIRSAMPPRVSLSVPAEEQAIGSLDCHPGSACRSCAWSTC